MGTAYIVLPFLVFVINAFLVAIVLRSDSRSFVNRIFAAFLAAIAAWGFTIFGMRSSPNLEVAYQWELWVFPAIAFAGLFFYHFALVFTGRPERSILRVLYFLNAVVIVLSFTGLIAPSMQMKFYGYAPVLGPAFPFYLAVAYTPLALAIWALVRARREAKEPSVRSRIDYVLMGTSLSIIGGTTDFLAPLGLHVYPMGIVLNIGFGVITTIAVTRHQLLGLRLLLRRGLAYSVLSMGIFGVYGVILVAFLTLFSQQETVASVLATISALMVATIALPPILARVQQWVDRLFFRERYDHLVALQEFTASTRDIADFVGLAESLARTVRLAMQADWVEVLIPSMDGSSFVPAGTGANSHPLAEVDAKSWVAAWLQRSDSPLSRRAMEYDPFLQAMADTERNELLDSGLQLLVPLRAKGTLTGILALGPRLVDDDYSDSDLRTLVTVASQTATMIENSRLYSQEMRRLQELERLNSLKSNLLRTVSHELKSPITAVRTAVDLLSEPDSLNEKSRGRLMRTLQNGVDRLQRLVGESLEYAQLQSAQLEVRREPTDLSQLVEGVVSLMSSPVSAKEQILEVVAEPDLPEVDADPAQIERVLLNLINNAHKFTPRGGTIQVAMSRRNGYVLTQVKDDGRGIPEEDQQHIFSEYYRGSNADGQEGAGTGLGLAIARSLVRMHGGEIWFESKVNEGTTFSFTVPVVHSQHNEPGSGLYVLPELPAEPARSSKERESPTAPDQPSETGEGAPETSTSKEAPSSGRTAVG